MHIYIYLCICVAKMIGNFFDRGNRSSSFFPFISYASPRRPIDPVIFYIMSASSLDDKDVEGIIEPLAACVENWIAVTASSPRAIDAAELARRVANATGKACLIADSPDMAIERARAMAKTGDGVLVTGSFFTVGPFLERLSARD